MVDKLSPPPPNFLMRKFINHAANQLHAFLWGKGKNKTFCLLKGQLIMQYAFSINTHIKFNKWSVNGYNLRLHE